MKKFIALLSCMLFILGSISTVYADENSTAAGSCSFTGKEMVSSFDSNKPQPLSHRWSPEILSHFPLI